MRDRIAGCHGVFLLSGGAMADDTTATIDSEPSIDIEAASDQIGADLFPESEPTKSPQETVRG